jgi:predicted  nucleic acid-binding Zn-ribbon protein
MPGPAAILRDIHRLRRHAKELQDRIEQGPRMLKHQQAKAARQEEVYQEAQAALKKLKAQTLEKESAVKTAQQLIKKYEKQRDEVTSKKELDALNAEIAAAKQKIGKLEDEILAAMEQAETAAARLPGLEKEAKQAREEAAQYEAEQQQRMAGWQEQYRQAMEAVAAEEAKLPTGPQREQYDRLIKARGEDAMSVVENQTCVACYTGITTQQQNDLSMEQFLLCRSCGRILYLAG